MALTAAQTASLQGLQAAFQRLETAASSVATGSGQPGGNGRMIEDVVDIKSAQFAVDANAVVLARTDETTETLLGTLDTHA